MQAKAGSVEKSRHRILSGKPDAAVTDKAGRLPVTETGKSGSAVMEPARKCRNRRGEVKGNMAAPKEMPADTCFPGMMGVPDGMDRHGKMAAAGNGGAIAVLFHRLVHQVV